jgi:two-component system NtrC family sensor kinase
LPKTLKFKVVFHLSVGLTVAVAIFTVLITRHHRGQLFQEAVRSVSQLSEVITKSTRFAMLQNQRSTVYRIIRDVGNQEGIEKVRVLSKDGMIIHSTFIPEIATKVDREAEACYRCHVGGGTPDIASSTSNSWTFEAPDGGRLLGHMDVIRNEPSCYENTLCHAHSEDQKVLGVLEITYSLTGIDRTLRQDSITIAGFSIGFVIVAALFVGIFIQRMIYFPLKDLETGSKRLSTGNLGELIPVRSRDEFGHLASSFNGMMLALRNSELELQEWNRTLELKVEEKTRELQIAEAKAAQAEKLASVGLLAAGIAHELNNPLTGILTFSHILRKKVRAESPEAQDLDLVIRETKRCSSIIKRLLDFAREKKPEKMHIDINQLLRETERLVHHPASFHDIEISMQLDDGLPPVRVDPDQIKQVFMNLLVNARDAIGDKGKITVRSRRLPRQDAFPPGQASGPTLEVSFTDTGSGIPEENLSKIFDPFFTTKEIGKGTGLGLAVTYGIVQAHGGHIDVESFAGKGTTFRIQFPLEQQEAKVTGAEDGRQSTGN